MLQFSDVTYPGPVTEVCLVHSSIGSLVGCSVGSGAGYCISHILSNRGHTLCLSSFFRDEVKNCDQLHMVTRYILTELSWVVTKFAYLKGDKMNIKCII